MHQLKKQKLDNNHLKQQITALHPQYLQTQKLQQEKEKLLEQNQDIKILQQKDRQVISLFKELSHIVPTGVHLIELNKQNNKITLIGKANLHTDIVELVENIKQSKYLTEPVVQTMKSPNNNKNKFVLTCLVN